MRPDALKTWVEIVVKEAAGASGLPSAAAADLYDDAVVNSPGRLASFVIRNADVVEWRWRTDDVALRADWPLRLVLTWGDGEIDDS